MSTVTLNQPSFDNLSGEFNTESFQNANCNNIDDINMQNNPAILSEPKPTILQTETKQELDNSTQDRLCSIESQGVVLSRKKVQMALANETELPLLPGKMEENTLTYDMKPGLPLQKYVYSAKFLSKLIPSHPPNSRLRLGNSTIEFKKHYDLNRNKYDEIIQMTKAANTIIAIFTAAKSCLEATSHSLLDPVATWCENSVNGLEAWTGMIAEALKLISIESAIIEGTPYVNKKRLLNDATQVLGLKFKDASERIFAMEKLVDRLTRVLEGCSRTIYCLNTGCRSRFYQSVWQTDIFLEQNGQGDANLEANEASSKLRCSSHSMSTSSLLSFNLLTAYVRWDVDGISIKKQVSKSWPLIKFSSLSFSSKVTSFAEIFSGFLVFLDIPTQNIWNALQSLQETSRPREEVTLLDHEFHTILAILLSERYFHPVEQHRALVCGIKLKKSFLLLQAELDKVKNCCKRLRDIWRKVFKNGELSLSAAAFAADATSVPLWKSCKDLNFQLDLCAEVPGETRLKFATYKTRDILFEDSPLTPTHQPKLLTTDFSKELAAHFELLEDYEESYESRLYELKHRDEFIINESDIRPCSDLAQQLFFHFEHIGSNLNNYTRSLVHCNNTLFNPIPTDPSTTPTIYTNFSPLRLFKDVTPEDNICIGELTGWLSAVLEMLHSTDSFFLKLPECPSLKKKCLEISKSITTLLNLTNTCVKNYRKAEKFIERVVSHVEAYFDPLEDNLKILSRVSSTEAMPVQKEDAEFVDDDTWSKVMNKQDEEVSIIVTLNGIYFNQFGVVFSSRLDVTTAEHRLRIVELFVDHTLKQIQDTIKLGHSIVNKFGTDNFTIQWWKQLIRPYEPTMLIDGSLEENIYVKTILYLMHNIETAFSKNHVKASLEIYSEFEALILIRSTRILEEEIVRFGKACQFMQQGLVNLEYYRKYYERSCGKCFNNSTFTPPFENWNNRLCCFKLVIQDTTFKNQMDKILSSTASENVSRNPSYIQFETLKSSLTKFNSSSGVISLNEIKKRFFLSENILLQSLHQENAFISETEPTASETTNLSPAAIDRKYMSPTEAASILIAHGVTQLKLEIFPKRSKVLLLKKLRSVCSKIKECRSIIAHSVFLSCSKMQKISDRLNTMLKTYSRPHLEGTNSINHPSATPTVAVNKPISSVSDLKPGVTVSKTNSEGNILEENELDVIIALSFAYGSLVLSYRGYERTASFRSWSQKPTDQVAVFDLMLEFISDRLSKVVETSRKVSLEYIQLNRKTKKLYEKIVQSPSVPFSTLTELISGFKTLEMKAQEKKLLRAIQETHDVLGETEIKLKLTVGFLEKHTEMIKSSNFTANDATLAIRNPFEKDIREFFTKPIRIVVPHDKISQKLW